MYFRLATLLLSLIIYIDWFLIWITTIRLVDSCSWGLGNNYIFTVAEWGEPSHNDDLWPSGLVCAKVHPMILDQESVKFKLFWKSMYESVHTRVEILSQPKNPNRMSNHTIPGTRSLRISKSKLTEHITIQLSVYTWILYIIRSQHTLHHTSPITTVLVKSLM